MLTVVYIMAGIGIVAACGVITGLSVLGMLVLYRMFTMWRLARTMRRHEEKTNANGDTDVPTA